MIDLVPNVVVAVVGVVCIVYIWSVFATERTRLREIRRLERSRANPPCQHSWVVVSAAYAAGQEVAFRQSHASCWTISEMNEQAAAIGRGRTTVVWRCRLCGEPNSAVYDGQHALSDLAATDVQPGGEA